MVEGMSKTMSGFSGAGSKKEAAEEEEDDSDDDEFDIASVPMGIDAR